MIIKFLHRDMKEIFYQSRNKLIGKTVRDLPSIANEYGKTIHEAGKIYINESLTQTRRKLYGKVNEFRHSNKCKYLITEN